MVGLYSLFNNEGIEEVKPEELFKLYYDRPNFITPDILQYYYKKFDSELNDGIGLAVELSKGRSFSGKEIFGVTVLDIHGVIYTDYVINISSNEEASKSFPTLIEAKNYINKVMNYEK